MDNIWTQTRNIVSRREARRNGPVENATVDIAGNVDYQIDVDRKKWLDDGNESWIMAEHG